MSSKPARNSGLFVTGLIVGIILMGISVWVMMPKMMLSVHQSRLPFEETVSLIQSKTVEFGWKVPKTYDISGAIRKAGHEDMTNLKIISLCHPKHAYDVLKNDQDKRVSAVMPCRISVYEDRSGKVFIAGMNLGLMGRMFGGNIAKVMGRVAKDEKAILESVVR